jgi:hypothetical protein
MPECVEIAAVATQLRALLLRRAGRPTAIEAATVTADSAPCALASPFPTLTEIVEHGKELEFRLATGGSIVVHFMLTGRLTTSGGAGADAVGSITAAVQAEEDELASSSRRITLTVCDPARWALVRYYATKAAVDEHWRAQAPAIWCSPEQRARLSPTTTATTEKGTIWWQSAQAVQDRANRLMAAGKSFDLAKVLKKQHGHDALCSGMGKWLIWQFQEELHRWKKQGRTPKLVQQQQPPAPNRSNQASLHAFFGSAASGTASKAPNVRRTNAQGLELFEIVDNIAQKLYAELLKEHDSIEALFAGYVSTRRTFQASGASSASTTTAPAAATPATAAPASTPTPPAAAM